VLGATLWILIFERQATIRNHKLNQLFFGKGLKKNRTELILISKVHTGLFPVRKANATAYQNLRTILSIKPAISGSIQVSENP
jgi:hypothetical protein